MRSGTLSHENAGSLSVTLQNDSIDGFEVTEFSAGGSHMTPTDEVIWVDGRAPSRDDVTSGSIDDNNVFISHGVEVPQVNKNISTSHPTGEVSKGTSHSIMHPTGEVSKGASHPSMHPTGEVSKGATHPTVHPTGEVSKGAKGATHSNSLIPVGISKIS